MGTLMGMGCRTIWTGIVTAMATRMQVMGIPIAAMDGKTLAKAMWTAAVARVRVVAMDKIVAKAAIVVRVCV